MSQPRAAQHRAALDRLRFGGEIAFELPLALVLAVLGIALSEIVHDLFEREAVVRSVVLHVLHVLPAVGVILLEQRIVAAVELLRQSAVISALGHAPAHALLERVARAKEFGPVAPENKALTWPDWPLKLRTSSAQEEGCERDWSVLTKRAVGKDKIEAGECARLEWAKGANGRMKMREIPGSAFPLKVDLVLLAMGFLGPSRPGIIEQLGTELDPRRKCARPHQRLRDLGAESVRCRRHAPRRASLTSTMSRIEAEARTAPGTDIAIS